MQKHFTMTDILPSIEAYLFISFSVFVSDHSFALLFACDFWWNEFGYNFPLPSVGCTEIGASVE